MDDPLSTWLIHEGSRIPSATELLGAVTARLNAAGLSLMRTNVVMTTLHPEVWGSAVIWQRSADFRRDTPGVEVVGSEEARTAAGVLKQVDYAAHQTDAPQYVNSPLYRIIDLGESSVRQRVAPDMKEFEYSIYRDFATQGATDYVALPLVFSTGARSASTWLTDKPGGFSDEDLATLTRLTGPLALILELHESRRVTRTLLNTYVGKEPGELVLAGKIRPGDVERIDAAIWFSDLRNFTGISAQLDSDTLIAWLNEYFRAVGNAIEAEGGGILKFIGDAILAIHPAYEPGDEAAACQRMLAAARRANEALNELNTTRRARGDIPLEHGIALHFGEVQYGNIGATRRLDFTVIGSAVNLASRLEGLCGTLGEPLVLSGQFAERAGLPTTSLGAHPLKGINAPVTVYRPAGA